LEAQACGTPVIALGKGGAFLYILTTSSHIT
jgi:glycosyltransferase involved in cell wall biosynthesis